MRFRDLHNSVHFPGTQADATCEARLEGYRPLELRLKLYFTSCSEAGRLIGYSYVLYLQVLYVLGSGGGGINQMDSVLDPRGAGKLERTDSRFPTFSRSMLRRWNGSIRSSISLYPSFAWDGIRPQYNLAEATHVTSAVLESSDAPYNPFFTWLKDLHFRTKVERLLEATTAFACLTYSQHYCATGRKLSEYP